MFSIKNRVQFNTVEAFICRQAIFCFIVIVGDLKNCSCNVLKHCNFFNRIETVRPYLVVNSSKNLEIHTYFGSGFKFRLNCLRVYLMLFLNAFRITFILDWVLICTSKLIKHCPFLIKYGFIWMTNKYCGQLGCLSYHKNGSFCLTVHVECRWKDF